MMTWIRIGLLLIALAAYVAGGAALAVIRNRWLNEGRNDYGMFSVTGALLAVGSLCTAAATGLLGILAFGGVSTWASYIGTAQRLGIFHVETGTLMEATFEEPHRRI
jgi:hypothetical protein